MNITRIPVPKFKVGEYILNEYEVRQLQVDFKEGKHTEEIAVCDMTYDTIHILKLNGRFDVTPKSFSLSYELVKKLLD
jgi:hypothetical protein